MFYCTNNESVLMGSILWTEIENRKLITTSATPNTMDHRDRKKNHRRSVIIAIKAALMTEISSSISNLKVLVPSLTTTTMVMRMIVLA
eukprot:scaffold164833_cov18-Prasinocladus_malaysianus.AAC.1